MESCRFLTRNIIGNTGFSSLGEVYVLSQIPHCFLIAIIFSFSLLLYSMSLIFQELDDVDYFLYSCHPNFFHQFLVNTHMAFFFFHLQKHAQLLKNKTCLSFGTLLRLYQLREKNLFLKQSILYLSKCNTSHISVIRNWTKRRVAFRKNSS